MLCIRFDTYIIANILLYAPLYFIFHSHRIMFCSNIIMCMFTVLKTALLLDFIIHSIIQSFHCSAPFSLLVCFHVTTHNTQALHKAVHKPFPITFAIAMNVFILSCHMPIVAHLAILSLFHRIISFHQLL